MLAVLMIASLLPVTALAANCVASGNCGADGDGTNLSWALYSDGMLSICGTGAMKDYYSQWRDMKIKTVVIDDGVTSIGHNAFVHCSELTSVYIPDSVTSIGNSAFGYCASLTDITIPRKVKTLNRAFPGCTSLSAIAVDDENPYLCSLDGIVYSKDRETIVAYPAGRSDTVYTIPDGVTAIGNGAFSGCSGLTTIYIPRGVMSIGDYAFSGCKSLTQIFIPKWVMSIGDSAFSECDSLVRLNIPEGMQTLGNNSFQSCKNLHSISLPTSLKSIGDCAFQHCTKLESIAIPNGVTTIGNGAFASCESLKSVTIPNRVTIIERETFSGCKRLESVTIPNSVTNILGGAFEDCSSLISITIPESVVNIDNTAFYACSSLTGIYVNDSNKHYASDAAGVLFYKDMTTLLRCPGAFRTYTVPDNVTDIHSSAFSGSTSLSSVIISDSVKCIGTSAFSECTSLTSVIIPDSVTSIGDYAFFGCTSLTSVMIPNRMEYIKSGTFGKCTSLTSVTIPERVTRIGDHAFFSCDKLTDVYYAGTEAMWGEIRIDDGNTELTNANIHYNSPFHEHNYETVVTPPTCTAKGYTTHTCACGDSYMDTYVNALGHSWDNGAVTKPATATEAGIKTYTCTRCSETKTEVIPATGVVDVTEMFTDVSHSWADDGIQYCVTHQLMSGVGSGRFAPKMTTTRAQIVQILYNLEGEPKVSGTMPFTDLTQNWYKDAVLWAYQTGVVSGTSATTFAPDQPVTREQIAVILMGYAEKVLGVTRTWTPADLSVFPDAGSVSGWAKDALADAVALGLISGASNGGQTYLEPQGSATREQVATILMEFCKNVKK